MHSFSSPPQTQPVSSTPNRLQPLSSPASSSPKHRVIIDTDPGVDDAMALFFAFGLNELSIEGITIVMGNHYDLDLLARNACFVMEMANNGSCGVYKGEGKPLNGEYNGHSGIEFHGQNGLGNIQFDKPQNTHLISENISAAQFIVDTCVKYKNEVTIITLGPYTNIAKAILLKPDLKNYVKQISSMGGVFQIPGNVSPVAEANIHNDPEAAKIVFQSGINITLAPLDVTHSIHMDTLFMNKLTQSGKIGKLIYNISQHYIRQYILGGIDEGIVPIHDTSAVMAIVKPEIFFDVKKICVDVETLGELTRGMTVADWNGHWCKEAHVNLLMKVDQMKYKEYYLETIQEIDRRIV